jgi:hypothetical protein
MSPFYISSELVDFFFGVELGPSYRVGPNGEYEVENKKLQTALPPKGDDGICVVNQMILNGLFSIYYRTHQLQSSGGLIKGDADLADGKFPIGYACHTGVDLTLCCTMLYQPLWIAQEWPRATSRTA